MNETLHVSRQAVDLLKSIESLRLAPYDDQTGKNIDSWVRGATIGYGHLISRAEWDDYKNGISEEQATALFLHDLAPYVEGVKGKVMRELTQNQLDALVILAFNIGLGAFARSSVLKLVNDPAAHTGYPGLEAAWKAWKRSQGRVMQGLVNRRAAEWNIYSKGIYQKW